MTTTPSTFKRLFVGNDARFAGIVPDTDLANFSGASGRVMRVQDGTSTSAKAEVRGTFAATGLNLSGATPLRKWRSAVAKVLAGEARAKLLFVGDSTTVGAGAGTGGSGNMNSAISRSIAARVASNLNRTVPTMWDSIWGSQNVTSLVTYPAYDPRVSLGTGWSMAGGGTLGSHFFQYTTGSAGTLAFTPTASCDRATVYYYRNAGQGSYAINVDGGATISTVSTAGAAGFVADTVSFAAGTHTINLVASNNGNMFISGVIPWLSTTVSVDVILGGWHGALAGTINGAGSFGPLTALRAIAPDCTVINLTINDSNAGTDMATYRGHMASIIAAAQESGDVILMVGPPSNTVAATNGTLDQYVATILDLADYYGCGVVDLKERWGSYAESSPTLPYFDNLHPNNRAYADVARALTNALAYS